MSRQCTSKTPTCHLSVFVPKYDIPYHGTNLWLVQVSCAGCVPSPLFAYHQPSCCAGRVGKIESLNSVQEVISNSQNTGLLSALGYRGYYHGNQLHLYHNQYSMLKRKLTESKHIGSIVLI